MDIDPSKGGWFSRITKSVTDTVKEIGSILTSDDDTPPTQNKPQSTGYMAQFDAVLNKELHPNQQPYPQATSPTNQYPPYDPHHTQQYTQQQQQPYAQGQQPPYTQGQQPPYGYDPSQQSQSQQQPPIQAAQDPSSYPPYMYANLQSQPQTQPSSYPSIPTPSFPSQTSPTYTPPSATTTNNTTAPFTPYVPPPVISAPPSPAAQAPPQPFTPAPVTSSFTPAPNPSFPSPAPQHPTPASGFVQPQFSTMPPPTAPIAPSQPSQPYAYQSTAYPETPAYLYTAQATNSDYYAQAQPGYQAPAQQGPAQHLPPPPVSNYWKERAATTPAPTVTPTPQPDRIAPRVDYSDLDPRSMDFVYSDRRYD